MDPSQQNALFHRLKRLNGQIILKVDILLVTYFVQSFLGTPVNIEMILPLFLIGSNYIVFIDKLMCNAANPMRHIFQINTYFFFLAQKNCSQIP